MMTEKESKLTAAARAKIASKAQAEAHRFLRRNHPQEYRAKYDLAKDELTNEELKKT